VSNFHKIPPDIWNLSSEELLSAVSKLGGLSGIGSKVGSKEEIAEDDYSTEFFKTREKLQQLVLERKLTLVVAGEPFFSGALHTEAPLKRARRKIKPLARLSNDAITLIVGFLNPLTVAQLRQVTSDILGYLF